MIYMYNIVKTTPNSILVSQGDRLMKVLGESFERGHDSPDFIIDIDSMRDWIVKDEIQPVSLVEKKIILNFLLEELSSRGWLVIAE